MRYFSFHERKGILLRIKRLYNIYSFNLSLIFIANALLVYFYQLYYWSIACFIASFFLFYLIFSKKIYHSFKLIYTAYILFTLFIFFASSYFGLNANLDLYYVCLFLCFPYSVNIKLEFKKIIPILACVSLELTINFLTNHSLFSNKNLPNELQNYLHKLSLFFTLLCSIISIFLIFNMKTFVLKLYNKKITTETKLQEFVNKNNISADDLYDLNNLAKQNSSLFFLKFSQAFPSFIQKIKKNYPSLTHNEILVCAYLKLNYSTKEIAIYSNSSVRSIENKKYRIRKKIELESKEDLALFISNF